MVDETERKNPLIEAARTDPLGRAQKQIAQLIEHWNSNGALNHCCPTTPKNPNLRGRNWLPEPHWISGLTAFEIIRLQCNPYESAPPVARICQIIADQWNREETGLNYAVSSPPPTHPILHGISPGSTHWFRAAIEVLTLTAANEIEGWERFFDELQDWLGYEDCLRIRAADLFDNALSHHWSVRELSLPETKQDPIWSFPKALAWIATRDYLALARLPLFCRPQNEEEAAADEGVWNYATKALGWLHTEISYLHCTCGALIEFGFDAYRHCTCISLAWEELVVHRGGLAADIPELVFNLQEGWLSMTWPDGADEIRFLRRDIIDRWPARPATPPQQTTFKQSTGAGEADCRHWLAQEFAADPEMRRSKSDFRKAALTAFKGRLTERGFNLRVWPELARDNGRDGAGAKKKS